VYTSTKVNHLSSVVKLGDLKIFLQEHEQREEESIAATQGKKWIVREEKQQQGKKDEQEQVSQPSKEGLC